jgi:Ni,Fe-hydrogenase III large subunit
VHAGVIGSGHFRFSVAGEPIINLETRLGWTHRGIEKLFEGRHVADSVKLVECVSGDTAFGFSLAFCQCVEKIFSVQIPERVLFLRGLLLELERMYNHAADIGGMAVDVGFSFPAQLASLIKEKIHRLNEQVSGSRYLKNINTVGGFLKDVSVEQTSLVLEALSCIEKDFIELEDILIKSVSFMDRLDGTGILKNKTARDLGIVGLAARASGIPLDLRKVFHGVYDKVNFKIAKEESADALARLKIRFTEFKSSVSLIRQFITMVKGAGETKFYQSFDTKAGFGLGYVEAWRGQLLMWISIDEGGIIERCKIVDPSFHNWEGLSYAVLGNIIPDFPLCNKSFDLSYAGNDL